MSGIIDHTAESFQHEDDFYFESDHLALKENPDYTALLKTLAILEVQKTQCLKNIDQLVEAERRALDDPLEFLENLKRGKELDVPKRIDVQELPTIDLEKYNIKIPESPKLEPKISNKNGNLVRGRIFDQSKPETFNQLWTFEEQKRLEELLIEYPPEAYESQRFTKIAKALGNRTPKQVASRVQKFFMKLHVAGLPIPGRLPKAIRTNSKYSKMQKRNRLLKPSTFFPAENVPVKMTDDEDLDLITPSMHHQVLLKNNLEPDKNCERNEFTQLVVVSQESEENLQNLSNDDKVLRLLKRIRGDLEIQNRPESTHFNFKCDNCLVEPIVGTRWHCNSCLVSVDFCSDCLVDQLLNPSKRHSLDHIFIGIRLQPVELSRKFADFNYSSSNFPSASNSRLASDASEDEEATPYHSDQNYSD